MQAAGEHTNKLINETSPYLLQHAHNPVDWYPWGDEAFEKAKADDKPILVSIGYSACHWCHVMAHESFEDEAAARVMNEHFVNIKVDMEERPDVDRTYMNFVQLTTGRGGWPMNVFLTPDKLPFFGGTYFPPSQRYGMPSWQQILMSIAEAWRERRDELLRSANDVLGELRRMAITGLSTGGIDEEVAETAYKHFVRSYDAANGGWGGAPKFPQAMSMEFLLRYWKRTGDDGALEMVRATAEKMAKGGIYDQLGGGFHRYAVDAIWLVPHFEKMLYDNAQLIRVYLHLYQATKDEFFKRIAEETLDYVEREMHDSAGGFYSSQDADSEGEEGKFFVWTTDEIIEVLGEQDGLIFNETYDVTADGNFEGKNIPNLRKVSGNDTAVADLVNLKGRLFDYREGRVKPFRDDKVLTAWNGLMLAAFAEAAAVLDQHRYLEIARRNADFLLKELVVGDIFDIEDKGPIRVLRTWKSGVPKLNGYVEDHANLADGLIELYQVTGEVKYLRAAKRLADLMITEFWDEVNGGFFFTANDHEQLIVRNKDLFDNAIPSGNSVAADVLLKLSKFYLDERYERFGLAALRAAADQVRQYPQGFGRALSAAEFYFGSPREIAIVGNRGNELEREIWRDFHPAKVVSVSATEVEDPPLLKGRKAINEKPTAYVCEGHVCQAPITSAAELGERLVR